MTSRRYFITTLPVEHINGKIAPQSVKCRATDDPDDIEHEGFVYGFRRRYARQNRYGIRKRSRYLIDHPYSDAELDAQDTFYNSVQVCKAARHDFRKWRLATRAWQNQAEYATLWGYVVAMTIKNGGAWPF